MSWIITTNTNDCRIYHYEAKHNKLTLIKEIEHPENREKTGDYLTSDKPGHFKSASSAHGAYSQRTDPKEAQIDSFARDIAHELDQGRTTNAYSKLVIITPAHMCGLIASHMDKHVKELVTHTIQKDVMHLSEQELLKFIQEHCH